MNERRRVRRRSFPFVRSGVLEVNKSAHIVAVLDLSPESAFLQTRITVKPHDALVLRMILPRDGREVSLPCEFVRRLDTRTGIAVRFKGLDPAAIRRIEEFSAEGFLPQPRPVAPEHFEYKVSDASQLDPEELNRLGFDGWRLSAIHQSGHGLRLVFMRRL